MARKTKAEAAATREALLEAAEEVFLPKVWHAPPLSKLLAMQVLPAAPFIGILKIKAICSWRWLNRYACPSSR